MGVFDLFDFADFFGGVTLYQRVSVSGSIGRQEKPAVGWALLRFITGDK
jgi:hypothetical protein